MQDGGGGGGVGRLFIVKVCSQRGHIIPPGVSVGRIYIYMCVRLITHNMSPLMKGGRST